MPILIFYISITVIFVVLVTKIFSKFFQRIFKKVYIKLPNSLKEKISKWKKNLRFTPYLLIVTLVYLCSRAFDFSGDGTYLYRKVVETPIEEVNDFAGYSSGFTDRAGRFSFQSNKYVRIRNINEYVTVTDTLYGFSGYEKIHLDDFKRRFRNSDLESCTTNDVIMKTYSNEKTKKERRTTSIDFLLIKNKGLYFFLYSWG